MNLSTSKWDFNITVLCYYIIHLCKGNYPNLICNKMVLQTTSDAHETPLIFFNLKILPH